MQLNADIRLNDLFLLPLALYCLASAALPALWPQLYHGALKEIAIYSLFVSPAIAILSLKRLIKAGNWPVTLSAALCSALATSLWIAFLWRATHPI